MLTIIVDFFANLTVWQIVFFAMAIIAITMIFSTGKTLIKILFAVVAVGSLLYFFFPSLFQEVWIWLTQVATSAKAKFGK